ncbi:putative carbonic anhydrase 5 isoform X1 [Rhipicephalus microplus]|uniref:putative carbonic anhydrase 5 isoform X1 n=1 Tax=Rhipicephalus microplus TaxID=6941 RepID=UPI003F6CF493
MPGAVCDTGFSQSPIEIPAGLEDEEGDFVLDNYDRHFKKFDVNVEGSAVMVVIKEPGPVPTVEGESVLGEGKFVLQQFHFHIGSNDNQGAEHKIDAAGRNFPMEVHFVHAREGKGSVAEALAEPGNVLVMAVLFQVEEKPADNKADAVLTAIIDKIGVSTDAVKALNLEDFVGPITTYYHYNGSLTTPPCTEGVKWIVLDSHPSVKSKTLQLLRDKSSRVRKDNFRPYRSPQKRRVKKYTAI